jgi:hypothetical protein
MDAYLTSAWVVGEMLFIFGIILGQWLGNLNIPATRSGHGGPQIGPKIQNRDFSQKHPNPFDYVSVVYGTIFLIETL